MKFACLYVQSSGSHSKFSRASDRSTVHLWHRNRKCKGWWRSPNSSFLQNLHIHEYKAVKDTYYKSLEIVDNQLVDAYSY
ncbi:hypothetical protein [Tolypothrix sp. NIES-4075]|uniref:hypothetical protein n=1 Tax=Tolypothrix sp. NIES-4075 TaxID=2005459 RepID=UPI00117F3EF4|nr:hypothetical protein [Tolypothrix sp. NIES-4075]